MKLQVHDFLHRAIPKIKGDEWHNISQQQLKKKKKIEKTRVAVGLVLGMTILLLGWFNSFVLPPEGVQLPIVWINGQPVQLLQEMLYCTFTCGLVAIYQIRVSQTMTYRHVFLTNVSAVEGPSKHLPVYIINKGKW